MAICYDLHAKMYYNHQGVRFRSIEDACKHLKKMIRECCNVDRELRTIGAEGLPAPKYRASVCRYIEALFHTDEYPSPDVIDYSDYEDEPRSFDTEKFSEFGEYDDVTVYERRLGFAFSAGENGMCLEFIASESGIATICYFTRFDDSVRFGFEPAVRDMPGLDVRVDRTNGELPVTVTGSFCMVMLLSALLKETRKRRLVLKNGTPKAEKDDPGLACDIESALYQRMNECFVLPSDVRFSESTLERCVGDLRKIGYDIKKDRCEIHTTNYKATNITNVINRYYLPPFICKRDGELVLKVIRESGLGEAEKLDLAERFKSTSGYHRHAESRWEESAHPMPKRREDWTSREVSTIIFNLLRLYARPLPVTSSRGENLKAALEKYYNLDTTRQTITRNVKSMIAIGLPIRCDGHGVYYDLSSDTLSAADLEILIKCITDSTTLSDTETTRLTCKLRENLPIGKY